MRCFIAMLALASGCAAAPAQRLSVELDQPFRLTVGGTGWLAGTSLQIRLVGILSDSRCPRGEQCVSAGNAVVGVELQDGNAAVQPRQLRTTPGATPTAAVDDLQLTLVDLEPQPVAGKAAPAERGAYVATLMVSRHGSTESSR